MSSTEIAAAARCATADRRPKRPARRPARPPAAGAAEREVRKFGLVVIVGFGLIGALLRWRGHSAAALPVFAGAAAAGAFAIALPRAARPLYRGWMALGHAIGRVSSAVILTAIHAVLFSGIGLLARAFGHDALRLRFDREATSYWEPKRLPSEVRRYFDQF
jgi:hypothetical protein